MKKKILIAILMLVMISFMIPASVQAETNYVINTYDVDVIVYEDNSAYITESITVDYTWPSHGIYRYIPTEGYIMRRVDGVDETQSYRVRLTDVSVLGYEYEVSRDSGYVTIKIGDPDYYVDGIHTYVISYRMEFPNDRIDAYDDVYLNLIGTDWETTINRANFTITMPKTFNTDLVNFTAGTYGSTDNTRVRYSISGNTIIGHISDLSYYEGVTLKIQLDDGYFIVKQNYTSYIAAGVTALLLLLVLFLFFKFGKDRKYFETVEFYPPEGMTPAEVGYIADGFSDAKDILSLITYWADHGYLSINEQSHNSIELTKLKDLPADAKGFEKTVFKGLFGSRTVVNTKDLRNTFYTTLNSAKAGLRDYFKGSKERRIFDSKSDKIKFLCFFLGLVALIGNTALAFYNSMFDIGVSIFLVILYIVGTGILTNAVQRSGITKPVLTVIKSIFSILMIAVGPILTGVYLIIYSYPEFSFPYLFSVLIIITITIISAFMSKRTPRGTELMGKIMGLKNFIEKAEKSRLERLVAENPSYFFDILPFAYVLGVTNKWIKQFESIAVEPPSWYSSYRGSQLGYMYMTSRLMSNMNTLQHSMQSKPSSSGSGGGGFSGGGGVSGGGFGGGGGGSW